jgi:aminopeptidase-like protein
VDSKLFPDQHDIGDDMHRLITQLYPICPSITGNGVRNTLGILGNYIPLKTHEVRTGTQVFDWTVPPNGTSPMPTSKIHEANT